MYFNLKKINTSTEFICGSNIRHALLESLNEEPAYKSGTM
jgi:hypothetical protein